MKPIPFYLVGVLFVLKLLSNVMIPVTLARLPRGPKGEEPGVSVMPYVDVVLLLVLLALSALGLAPYGFLTTLLVGIVAIVLSYVLLYVVAIVMGVNHHMLTGSNDMGELYGPKATCLDWTTPIPLPTSRSPTRSRPDHQSGLHEQPSPAGPSAHVSFRAEVQGPPMD